MEANLFFIVNVCLGLLVLQQVLLGFFFFKINKINKELVKTQTILAEETAANSKDLTEVMSKFMKYLENEFNASFENQKKMQEWLEKNLEVLSQNTVRTNTSIEQTQRFLGRMSDALGIVQRSNLQDV